MTLNYQTLGLKAGLEVHQQLDTGKLFIRTPSTLTEDTTFTIERKLRPVASELGEYDKTALDAFKRNETFIYAGNKNTISLVELDEEPPQPMDEDALKTVLEVALLCHAHPLSTIATMRKTVIDGSNTSAFQRTALIAMGGSFEIPAENNTTKKIGVQTIVLEEDAARPIKKEAGKIYYNLDRLGIPLIELATDPDIRTPAEAIATAKKIGEVMRLTCATKRGKGTIRQDVNVSIAQGTRCEIKGCQELELIGTVVEKEAERQLDLLALKDKLTKAFGVTPDAQKIFGALEELTHLFTTSECKFVKGKTVFGMKLTNFKGYLGEKVGAKRFGSELSAYAKATGVSGLLHRDELPNYGITQAEVETVCKKLGCTEKDNFVIIVAEKERAQKAFDAIIARTLVAFTHVPKETRGALEDGSSEYQRPLAGEARMYPETDIPTKDITEKYLLVLSKGLPKSVRERETQYAAWGLSTNHIEEMKLSNYARFFEETVMLGANPKVSASLLLQTFTELKRTGVTIENVSREDIRALLLAEKKGDISKNNLAESISALAQGTSLLEVLSSKKNTTIDTTALETAIQEIITKNKALVNAKGLGAIGPLMGDVMKTPQAKGVEGKVLSELLKKALTKK